MQKIDPVREVRDAGKQNRRQPKILREATEAVNAEQQKAEAKAEAEKSQKKKKARPPKAKKEAPEKKNPTPNPSPNPNPNPNPAESGGAPGMSDEKDDGDGKLPFTIGERPEEEEEPPITLEPEAQDPVVFLTGLVNGLADKMGLLMQKVSAHDQMITFAKQVLREQGVEIPEMEGAAPQPAGAAAEEGAVPEEGTTAEPDPPWLVGLKTVTEFVKHAKEFADSMGSPEESGGPEAAGGSEAPSDPFDAVGALVTKVFEIEDKISTRAAKAHEANLKALGPVIREVVQNVVASRPPPE